MVFALVFSVTFAFKDLDITNFGFHELFCLPGMCGDLPSKSGNGGAMFGGGLAEHGRARRSA